ncbi:response regulator transcription factor [Amphritea sp. 2_MG-2023]|jgi:two-component system invasion response regulator UvrY|uniref:response regulator n=1 Tax=Amphritea TaxID=515417 RepID=UPI001C06FC9B|nr:MULTISPECIES: response regulator transcription factor [Amphritea]MBU2966706.1 response regulator transcription factor [Amphritea atlantica]MDO6417435.1 response regulator transcription factor [Amphritea sp. 2_MG-2023]MDX2422338.1 response regulator transcription factor [Amphritea sp.]
MSAITVLLVDDHPVVRAGFQRLLDNDSQIDIIAEASSGQEAVEKYLSVRPDVVIMDLSMPTDSSESGSAQGYGGLEAIRVIRAKDPEARVLVLTVMESEPFPAHVVQAGASGYLTKRCAPDELIKAVHMVSEGHTYYAESIREMITPGGGDSCSPFAKLTKREFQVFSCLAQGHSAAQVAEDMFLSPKTVHAHRANILRKLGINNNSELVHLAIRHKIVEA